MEARDVSSPFQTGGLNKSHKQDLAGDLKGKEMKINSEPRLMRHAPYFLVEDVESTGEFYTNVLGFELDYIAGDPAEFVIYSRDALSVMFRRKPESEEILPNEMRGGMWDLFFWVENLEVLFDEFKANQVQIVYGPIYQEAYRMDEFAIRDLNGYVLGFGESRYRRMSV